MYDKLVICLNSYFVISGIVFYCFHKGAGLHKNLMYILD